MLKGEKRRLVEIIQVYMRYMSDKERRLFRKQFKAHRDIKKP